MYLNCHTYYSFKFGTMSPEDLLREAQSKGVRKLVLADINNTSGILDFFRLAAKEEYQIKTVAGIDFRNGIEQKFIGIAKNMDGFRELNDFLSLHLKEQKEFNDRAPAFHHAFVIYPFASVTSDFLKGKALLENEFIGIKSSDLNKLRFSGIKHLHDKLVILQPVTFKETDKRIIGNREITFKRPHIYHAHRLLRAMHHNMLLSKLPESELAGESEIMFPEDNLREIFKEYPSAIENTSYILEKCRIDFEFEKNKNKKYFTGNQRDDYNLLLKLCDENLSYRYPYQNEKIIPRCEKEIKTITENGFTSYFLINWDIVRYARERKFFYVGRGSGANSMVAYLLQITDVDPIELDLYFERFINTSRKNPPDFDIDFSWADRDEIIRYIFNKYGEEYTALLGTYSTLQDNAIVRELGKVYGLPKKEIDAFSEELSENNRLDPIGKHIVTYGTFLKDFPSHLSIHAGGILISQEPIHNYTATSFPPKEFPLTQFSMLEAEDVGLFKFDILSQRGLGKIKDAVELIRKNKKEDVDIHDVKRFMKDEKVSDHLKHAKLMGCFYVESPAMRMLLTKLKATTYLDLVAASSIIRPGVAQSGMMQEYIRRFHDESRRQYAHPLMKELMEETFGIMVYQEDVIKVAHFFGKLSLEEADKLRRGMGGKYKGREEFAKVKGQFFSNCRREGYDEKLINDVWFQMETFGGYAFAKGHSASYAVESYQCMFLKVYYPLEFMVAVINNEGGFFRQEYYIHEAYMMGAKIHAPHINHSESLTTIEGENIYLGFGLMKDLEEKTREAIVIERIQYGPYRDLADFIRRVSISVEQLRLLIRIGTFRFTGRTKKQLMWDIHSILGHQKKSTVRKELFEGENKKYLLPELFNDEYEDARDENEILGYPLCSPFRLIKQPLSSNLLAADFPANKNKTIEIIGYYVTRKPTSTKKGEAMMFGCFLDRKGYFFDTNHFPEATKNFPFRGPGCYLVRGKVAEEFGFYSINVLEMHKLDYLMYEDDAEEKARSKPDPVIVPKVIEASKQYQYLLVISPPPHIWKEIELLKKKFHQQFDHYQAIASKPHITLSGFVESETKEMETVKRISGVASQCPPLKVSLEDFKNFDNHKESYSIVIDVMNPDEIIGMVQKLKKELSLPSKYSRFIFNPHVTMARGLDQEKFSRASAEFCEMNYAASFVARSITLLKREANVKFAKYEVVREFRLEGRANSMPMTSQKIISVAQ